MFIGIDRLLVHGFPSSRAVASWMAEVVYSIFWTEPMPFSMRLRRLGRTGKSSRYWTWPEVSNQTTSSEPLAFMSA